MVKAKLYVEGGGEDAASLSACREGFRKLLERAGFENRMPRIVACGGRQSAYRDFRAAHKAKEAPYVALLVDSEDPITDLEKPWDHLATRANDAMPQPAGAIDDQALVMATCMETWIVADRDALRRIYKGDCLQESALPPLVALESRSRHDVQNALTHATRDCKNRYEKGKRSFKALEEVDPSRVRKHLPSFERVERILRERL